MSLQLPQRRNNNSSNSRPPRTGWMNYRVAMRLTIDEDETSYTITTRIPNIVPESMRVELHDVHLIVEGQVRNFDGDLQFGRYVRHVDLKQSVNEKSLTAMVNADDELIVRVDKKSA